MAILKYNKSVFFKEAMSRKPTDRISSSWATRRRWFHHKRHFTRPSCCSLPSKVLNDVRIGYKAEQEWSYHIRGKSRRERKNNRVHQIQCTRLGAGARVSHARDLFLGSHPHPQSPPGFGARTPSSWEQQSGSENGEISTQQPGSETGEISNFSNRKKSAFMVFGLAADGAEPTAG